ncbi:MAG TPA: ArdC-like ssDNA-binding domain-containing protein [Acidimicrobiales bacterium]|nr:ArdC-like ssDNA-binding domain-containing protein [Acidimicrobiales bacterium]
MSAPTPHSGGEDRLTEVHEQLTAAVEALVSGEDWASMLAVAARFHRYSLNNVMLIQLQMPDATRVAGYRAWQALGHQVRRGEHGIAILAPVLRRVPDERGRGEDDGEAPSRRQVLTGFKLTRVFDISQTDGPPLPDVAPELLSGDAPAALYDGLAAQVTQKGYELVREDCSPANGRTNFAARTVTVRPDCSPAQAAKTLAHELGHVYLHEEGRLGGLEALFCRGREEVEAESVAYLVCASAGLQTGGYSFPYVARWASGDVELVKSAAERSLGAARTITTALGLSPAAPDSASEAVLERSRAQSHRRPAPAPRPPERSLTRGVSR